MTDVAEELVQASANTNTLQEYIDLIKTDQLEDPNTLEQDVADQTESLISIEEVDSFSVWQVVSSAAINLVLPFINGLMLGFGEIVAHEIGFKYGWYSAKVEPQQRLIEGRIRMQLEKEQEAESRRGAVPVAKEWL